MRKKPFFFALTMVKHWKRLHREVVESPSLEIFRTWLNPSLSHLL